MAWIYRELKTDPVRGINSDTIEARKIAYGSNEIMTIQLEVLEEWLIDYIHSIEKAYCLIMQEGLSVNYYHMKALSSYLKEQAGLLVG